MTRIVTREQHYQAVLDRYQAERRLPSIVAGVLDGGELRLGRARAGASRRATDTQYRIGSITKTITAVLVLQCRDEGLLDLDDPLGEHLPETGYADATLRSLLAHVSGMQSEPVGTVVGAVAGCAGRGRCSPRTTAAERSSAPGEHYHYSNLGFALLGEAVARVRRRLLVRRWCRHRILEPLGDDADVVPPGGAARPRAERAPPPRHAAPTSRRTTPARWHRPVSSGARSRTWPASPPSSPTGTPTCSPARR